MPRGVKKSQEAEVVSENNVTVVGEEKESETISKSATVEVSYEKDSTVVSSGKFKVDGHKKTDGKKSGSAQSVKQEPEKSQPAEDRFYCIERPVPMYLAKNVASPLLAMVSGKCKIRSQEGSWIKITIGVPEKGATTGYILKGQAMIK